MPLLADADGAVALVTLTVQDQRDNGLDTTYHRYADFDDARSHAYRAARAALPGDVTLSIIKEDNTYGRRWFGIFRAYT